MGLAKGQAVECDDTTYLIQKIWGCLADVTPERRYNCLANSNDSNAKQRLTQLEADKFRDELKRVFKLDLNIDTKRTFKRVVTEVRYKLQAHFETDADKRAKQEKLRRDNRERMRAWRMGKNKLKGG